MKIYKWLRGLMKVSALTTVMFIMQACYGSPYMPSDLPEEMEVEENDTLVLSDSDLTELKIKLESNQ